MVIKNPDMYPHSEIFNHHQSIQIIDLKNRIFIHDEYRIYFGEDGEKIVVLLCGGDKATQKNDIKKAGKEIRERSV